MLARVRALAQAGMPDLARLGPRQRLDDLDVLGCHEVLERRLTMANDVARGQPRPRTHGDECFDRLAQRVVRNPNHRAPGDVVQLMDYIFNLTRRNLFATGLDDVVLARDEVEISVAVAANNTPGAHHHCAVPRIDAHTRRSLSPPLPVTTHHLLPA